ncbi:hypothetical protein O181_088496 [Austropuccinia psidii MF-1]|uniref:Uncharacterized protein n=1 Tax=Austropuccinia psidii MF-1 TaxID=1389203 RepID=A0A9Q3P704_9BASI|nr:hypothetical protein [Austropuccinia psidii MF-1]
MSKPEDWKDMDEVLQLHHLLKDLFQWRMEIKRFNLASDLEELKAGCHMIYLEQIPFKYLMVIAKGLDPKRQFKILEEREARTRDNQATVQEIEGKLNPTQNTVIPSGSQGVNKPDSPVASHHSGTNRSVTKCHHSSQSQVGSRRRQGSKVKNKNSFNQRQKDSDLMIQKILDLVKEVHKSQK